MRARSGYDAKQIYMSDADKLSDIFKRTEPMRQDKNLRTLNDANGFYCLTQGHPTGHHSLWVYPTTRVRDFIREQMDTIVSDQKYFKLVWRGDEVLVTVEYGTIIGSRWLTMVPPSELDQFGWSL